MSRRPFVVALGTLAGLVVLAVATTMIVGCALSGPGWRGPVTDHFDGKHFQNGRPVPHGGFGRFLEWRWSRHPSPWVDRNDPPGPKPPDRIADGKMRVTFVNHATVLVQQDGLNVLADPIWSQRASPFSWIGPHRHRPPGLRFEDLPPIDVVVLSHNHYDHLDVPTLKRIQAAHHPRFFTGLGNRPILERDGIGPVTEMDWWQVEKVKDGVELVAVPAQHFSARGMFDRDQSLWMGFVVRGPAGMAYVAGDTGAGPHFAEIRKRLGAPRLAVLPIGAYEPAWFMSGVHQSPAQAVQAADALKAGTSVGMHFGTFALADDGQDEPPRALEAALEAHSQPPPRFWVLGFGEGRDVP
jgi:L-ascorbate metabolism protein UlaG (beta-lactamase superfamily)